jgi:glycosyltransferase involved in cell wall biosynthesis
VAFVHDWLVTFRGGEKVLEALLSLYPDAPIYTLFYDPSKMPGSINSRTIHTPAILNPLRKVRKLCLPLLPKAIESFNLDDFDLVISTSSCVAKGAITAKHAKHLCYIHSPMRYIWDQQDEYIKGVSHIPMAEWGIKKLTPKLRKWDIYSSKRVDQFIANSSFVAQRTLEFYERDSKVIHPPIDVERFKTNKNKKSDYLLCAGAFVSYKRFDLAIKACEDLGQKLIVAGSGPMESQLRDLADSNTQFVISPSNDKFDELLRNADALIFPGVEDFGMIAIEAMASGTPVLAYKKGGATDFIKEGKTGSFFTDPTWHNLAKCIEEFDAKTFDQEILSRYAEAYSTESFLRKIRLEIDTLLKS